MSQQDCSFTIQETAPVYQAYYHKDTKTVNGNYVLRSMEEGGREGGAKMARLLGMTDVSSGREESSLDNDISDSDSDASDYDNEATDDAHESDELDATTASNSEAVIAPQDDAVSSIKAPAAPLYVQLHESEDLVKPDSETKSSTDESGESSGTSKKRKRDTVTVSSKSPKPEEKEKASDDDKGEERPTKPLPRRTTRIPKKNARYAVEDTIASTPSVTITKTKNTKRSSVANSHKGIAAPAKATGPKTTKKSTKGTSKKGRKSTSGDAGNIENVEDTEAQATSCPKGTIPKKILIKIPAKGAASAKGVVEETEPASEGDDTASRTEQVAKPTSRRYNTGKSAAKSK
ncbi:hypothetical protein ONZ45_g6047 [Pleurotus djamor]|nr:hypothetical protein ONZ45_g6047 [Pleurotus djamor]